MTDAKLTEFLLVFVDKFGTQAVLQASGKTMEHEHEFGLQEKGATWDDVLPIPPDGPGFFVFEGDSKLKDGIYVGRWRQAEEQEFLTVCKGNRLWPLWSGQEDPMDAFLATGISVQMKNIYPEDVRVALLTAAGFQVKSSTSDGWEKIAGITTYYGTADDLEPIGRVTGVIRVCQGIFEPMVPASLVDN